MTILVQGSRPGAGATNIAKRSGANMTVAQRRRATAAMQAEATRLAQNPDLSTAEIRRRSIAAGQAAARAPRATANATFNEARNAFNRARKAGQSVAQARRAAQRVSPGVTTAELRGPRR